MYNKMKIVFLAFILLSTILSYSQTNYSIKHFTTNDGLLSNKRIEICQDGHGYYWFGSEKGLQRFDGNLEQPRAASQRITEPPLK